MLKTQKNEQARVTVQALLATLLIAIGAVTLPLLAATPINNLLPQGAMQGDLNAGGHSLTNAGTVSATNGVFQSVTATNGISGPVATTNLVGTVTNVVSSPSVTGMNLQDTGLLGAASLATDTNGNLIMGSGGGITGIGANCSAIATVTTGNLELIAPVNTANGVLQLTGGSQLPAVDASLLTGDATALTVGNASIATYTENPASVFFDGGSGYGAGVDYALANVVNAANGLDQLDATGAFQVSLVNTLSPNSSLNGLYYVDASGDFIDLTDDGTTHNLRIENAAGSYVRLGYGNIDIFAYPANPTTGIQANLILHNGARIQLDGGASYGATLINGSLSASRNWTLPDASGKVAIMTSAPATSSSAGVVGQIAFDSSYFYVCVATNTWKRILLTTF